MVALVVFIMAALKTVVHLVVMFSKMRLDLYIYVCIGRSCMKWYLLIADVQMLYKVGSQ